MDSSKDQTTQKTKSSGANEKWCGEYGPVNP